jgi:hypothetical protein
LYGLDYIETFIPTIRIDILRLFLTIVVERDLVYYQYNVKNIFTKSTLKETIFLKPLLRLLVKLGFVLQALKSLYSLKQGVRDWNNLIKFKLIKWGFVQSLADLYLFINKATRVKLLVYINNIIAAIPSSTNLDNFYAQLSSRFTTKNLGEISKILGVRVTYNRKNRTLEID